LNPLNLFRRFTTWAVLAAVVVGGVLSYTSSEARTPQRRLLVVLGGRAWQPSDVATLVVRLDFDDISSLSQTDDSSSPVTASGQSIGWIRNKGTLGGAFSQGTGTAKPTYDTFSGSLLGASFDGGDSLVSTLSASNFSFLHNGSRRVIMIDMVTPASAAFQSVLDTNNASSAIGAAVYCNTPMSFGSSVANGSTAVINAAGDTVLVGTRYTRTERFEDSISGNDFIRRINGTETQTAERAAVPSASGPNNTLYIGARPSGSGFTGKIRRIRIWHVPPGYPDDFLPLGEAEIVKP